MVIKKFFAGLWDMFTGRSIDNELNDYILEHNPTDAGQVEQLEREFWRYKAQAAGYFFRK